MATKRVSEVKFAFRLRKATKNAFRDVSGGLNLRLACAKLSPKYVRFACIFFFEADDEVPEGSGADG